ncbi:MAG: MMPL family transporter [Alphaproteobacteria bacterium]|nr:MMPL family transporter [Alphaproteobacteria bacterium]
MDKPVKTPPVGRRDDPEEDLALGSTRVGWLILKWRLWIIVGAVLFTVFTGYGIRFLTFNPDTRAYFGPENPERIALDRVEAKYAQIVNVILVLAPKDKNVFSPQFLTLLADVTNRAWKAPHSYRVESLANFQQLQADGDDLKVSPLYNGRKPVTPEVAAEVRRRALGNKDIVANFVGPSGEATSVVILFNKPKGPSVVPQIGDFVEALKADIEKTHPEVNVYLTGGIMADLSFVEAAHRDTLFLVPLMAVIILGVLLIGMRSMTVTLVTSVVIGLTVVETMGIYGWFGEVLNTVTAAAPPIIMTLFFADCVHFVMAAVQQQTHGRSREQSIVETIRLNLLPTLIKSATSIVGFLALNFSDSPPLNQLGNVVAVGSLIGAVLTVTLIPAMLSYLPIPKYTEEGRTHRIVAAMANWVVTRNRQFLYGFAILFPLALLAIPYLKINDNFVQYFDKSFEFRIATDYLEQHISGLHALSFSVPAGEADGITNPEYLKTLDAFAAWYRKQPHVVYVSTLADVVRRINKAMNSDKPEFDRIPDNKKLIAQYLFLYELSLPPGQDMSSLVDVGRSDSLVTVRLTDVSSNEIIALADAGNNWLKQHAPTHVAPATGMSLVYSWLTVRNIQAMLLGTAVSVLAVSLIMAAALRNWFLGWISLLINLAPAAVAFGVWSLTGSEVNLAISVVTSITYGIVTDDTVHTMTKYRWARRILGMSPFDAARETLTYTGGAVILASLALSLGFALLGFSSFNITSVMGTLAALIIAIAALAELLLLPGLLILFDRGKL